MEKILLTTDGEDAPNVGSPINIETSTYLRFSHAKPLGCQKCKVDFNQTAGALKWIQQTF